MKSRRAVFAGAMVLGVAAIISIAWRAYQVRRLDQVLRDGIRAARSGRSRDAMSLLDEVLSSRPDEIQANLYRGQLAREAGDSRQALALLRRIPDDSPIEAGAARFIEASILMESHQARRAEALLRRSIELNPLYPQPRERLSQLLTIQARGRAIREVLQGLRQIRPLTLQEQIACSDAVGSLYDAEKNIPFLEQCISTDPDDLESMIGLARYWIATEKSSQVAGLIEPACPKWPDDPRLIALLAEATSTQGGSVAIDRLLEQWRTGQFASPEIFRASGLRAFNVENWENAAAWLEHAWLSAPDDLQVAYKLGQAWERSGLHQPARDLLERSRLMDKAGLLVYRVRMGNQQRPDLLAPILTDIATAMMRLDRLEEAREWMQIKGSLQSLDETERQLVTTLDARIRAGHTEYAEVQKLVNAARIQRQRSGKPSPGELHSTSDRELANQIPGASRIRLTDVHVESGLKFQYFTGRSEFKYLIETLGGGVAAFDFDGDHWPDLYFTQGGTVPGQVPDRSYRDRLFRNLGDGTFVDVTEQAGLGDLQYSQGCTAGDYDEDGDCDLFIANFGTNVVYRNNGDGTFEDVTSEAGLGGDHWSSSMALADLDGDADLDLYVVTYVREALKICRTATGKTSTCSPGNFPAEDDILYLNTGDGRFVDISSRAGVLAPDGKGLGVIVADFDDDRRPDVYVANDGTPNFLFHNLGTTPEGYPTFEEIGLAAGCAVNADGASQAGMGIACADFNEDGRLDVHVTNFYLEGSALYINDGSLQFHDASRTTGLLQLTRSLLGFGTQAFDGDLDGRLELIVTNGHIDDFSFRNEPWKMPTRLYRSEGQLRWKDVSDEAGEYFQSLGLGRGLCRVDWNRDGRPDVVIVHQDRPAAVLRNDTEECGHYLAVELRGTRSNRDALGARIRYRCGEMIRTCELSGGDGYFAVNDRRQILGLGRYRHVDELEIDWPDGEKQVWNDLMGDRAWLFIEGGKTPLMVGP